MSNEFKQFEQRKQDHIELAMLPANQASEASILDQISFWHEALPDLNFADIDIASTRFGERVPNPFMISSMTAGHQGAIAINTNLLAAANTHHWAMGVGSQRRELDDPNEAIIWRNLRRMFPDVTLFSNLGIAQIITSSTDDLHRITDAISARALIIHCNPLQEALNNGACVVSGYSDSPVSSNSNLNGNLEIEWGSFSKIKNSFDEDMWSMPIKILVQ